MPISNNILNIVYISFIFLNIVKCYIKWEIFFAMSSLESGKPYLNLMAFNLNWKPLTYLKASTNNSGFPNNSLSPVYSYKSFISSSVGQIASKLSVIDTDRNLSSKLNKAFAKI